MTSEPEGHFLGMLNLSAEEAWQEVPRLASELTGKEHLIRSAIIDLHFIIEVELQRLLFHCLKQLMLFATDEERQRKLAKLGKEVDRLSFGQMHRLLAFTLDDGPWPDLQNAKFISETRNQIAHSPDVERVYYKKSKGRNPFRNPDALAEMYFDVWAMTQTFPKLFWRTLEEPWERLAETRDELERYKKKYGPLDAGLVTRDVE